MVEIHQTKTEIEKLHLRLLMGTVTTHGPRSGTQMVIMMMTTTTMIMGTRVKVDQRNL